MYSIVQYLSPKTYISIAFPSQDTLRPKCRDLRITLKLEFDLGITTRQASETCQFCEKDISKCKNKLGTCFEFNINPALSYNRFTLPLSLLNN